MYQKKCPKCDQYSYSSSKEGLWRCPYCNADISRVKVKEDKKGGKMMDYELLEKLLLIERYMIDIVSDQVEDYNYFLEVLSVLQNIIMKEKKRREKDLKERKLSLF